MSSALLWAAWLNLKFVFNVTKFLKLRCSLTDIKILSGLKSEASVMFFGGKSRAIITLPAKNKQITAHKSGFLSKRWFSLVFAWFSI